MKRVFVFLLLSPVSVFFAGVLIWSAFIDGKHIGLGCLLAAILAVATWPVSAIAAAIDGGLASDMPISFRVPLMAFIGATMVAIEIFMFLKSLPSPSLFFIAAGAVWTGGCSLLSHDYRSGQQPSLQSA
jgi:hypothetical protein